MSKSDLNLKTYLIIIDHKHNEVHGTIYTLSPIPVKFTAGCKRSPFV